MSAEQEELYLPKNIGTGHHARAWARDALFFEIFEREHDADRTLQLESFFVFFRIWSEKSKKDRNWSRCVKCANSF